MSKALVIVESPTKAKKIQEFLGTDDYIVESSVGHIRDLPMGAKQVPAAYKGESWSNLGVNVESDFKPIYVVNKKDVVSHLKNQLKQCDELLLATDEDREGEAIAWHLLEALNPPAGMPVRRMVFHEITKKAIEEAVASPRDIDLRLVDAQETRRILDRLIGFPVSQVAWRKVMPQLSVGRVQSPATRLIVERERERMAFVGASYWDLTGTFHADAGDTATFGADLHTVDGTRVAGSGDFGNDGRLAEGKNVVALGEAAARALADGLSEADVRVASVEAQPRKRSPNAPFTTSTFQQAAGGRLRMSSAQAMRTAQSLYEQGYITYMRTDSTTLSADAVAAARSFVAERFGDAYLPSSPRTYAKKSKNAQEAHEAIRPAGEQLRHPDEVARELTPGEANVYRLIWERTVASQMVDAQQERTTVVLVADTTGPVDLGIDAQASPATVRAEFKATGTVTTFDGFLAVYDNRGADDSDANLPTLAEGQTVTADELEPRGRETSPPRRYTEPQLVKKLEELGIGRPSTYASIIQTIQDRGYVMKQGGALVPTWVAFAVTNMMETHYGDLVNYEFTAQVEDDLDRIATGAEERTPWLERFYWGRPDGYNLAHRVSDEFISEIDAAAINTIVIGADDNGEIIVAKPGKYGPYVKRGDDTASIPEELAPDELTVEKALELLSAPREGRSLGTHPDTGLEIFAKAGRFGPYVTMGDPDDLPAGWEKPKTASLFNDMRLDTVTLDDAIRLLSLPRVVGEHPSGGAITALNGRYGPYLSWDKPQGPDDETKPKAESRSLGTEDELFTVTVAEAVELFNMPKYKAKAKRAAAPVKEVGTDPATGLAMTLRDGRFGPYVSDGEINASLRKGDTPENLTTERAAELLELRRQYLKDNPQKGKKKRGAKKKAAAKKKSAKKKAAAKKKSAKKQAAATQAPPASPPPDADEPF